jgi:hypothetical protein
MLVQLGSAVENGAAARALLVYMHALYMLLQAIHTLEAWAGAGVVAAAPGTAFVEGACEAGFGGVGGIKTAGALSAGGVVEVGFREEPFTGRERGAYVGGLAAVAFSQTTHL